MKVYMVTVDDKTARIINGADANNEEIYIGSATQKRPVKEIELYVNINDDE